MLFRSRVTVNYHLLPLDADETANYINHRLRRAAVGAPVVFPREATDAIHARSRGVPRIINVICDAALVFGYAEERRTVDLRLVEEVLGELEATNVLPPIGSVNVTESAPTSGLLAGAGVAALAPVAAGPVQGERVAEPRAERAVEARAESLLMRDLSLRAAELDRREQAVRQRERELADQRRILAEEYRLLRSRTAGSPGGYVPPQSVRVQVQTPFRSDAGRTESLWQRVKRIMQGASHPAME